MKWYLRGFTNYDHHEDAKFAFKRVREGVVAMRLCNDGTAYIAELTNQPVQPGQEPFKTYGCQMKGTEL
jgi:uncharacterized protein YlaI